MLRDEIYEGDFKALWIWTKTYDRKFFGLFKRKFYIEYHNTYYKVCKDSIGFDYIRVSIKGA